MRYFLFLICLSPLLLVAQISAVQLSLDTKSGYEYNAFNSAKNKFTTNTEGDTISRIQSGAFQYLGIQGGWKTTLKKHNFGITTKIRMDNYWQLKTANLLRSETRLTYSYALKKTSSLYFNSKYLIYQTNRFPNEVEVIAIPAAYKRLTANFGYKWRPFKRNKTQLEMNLLRKAYSPNEDTQLKYSAFGLNLSSTQRFKKKGKPSSYLRFELDVHQRNYVDAPINNFLESLDDEAEDFEALEKLRTWQYYTLETDYSFSINQPLKLTTGLAFQYRRDVLEEQYGYRQWQPFVEAKWTMEKLTLKWKMSMAFRTFSNLKADSNKLFALQHRYWRNSFYVTYQLTDQWALVGQVNFRKRGRNQPPKTTNRYLSYFTGLISMGIRYKLNKKGSG